MGASGPQGSAAPTKGTVSVFILFDVQLWGDVDLIGDVFAVLFALADTFGEKVFDLTVHRTKIIFGPSGDGGVELGGEAEGICFLPSFFGSAMDASLPYLIETAGVDDGLGIVVAAEDHQKVGDHGGFALLVQLD